jgi:hypothetical protein
MKGWIKNDQKWIAEMKADIASKEKRMKRLTDDDEIMNLTIDIEML